MKNIGIAFLIVCYCAALTGGALLVHYNLKTECLQCILGYNDTMINQVEVCYTTNPFHSYNKCHPYYVQPGFGFGVAILVICWVIVGAPAVVVVDI